jgi:ATP-binding cassette subfamily B protein
LVLASSALTSVVPWLLKDGVDDIRAGAPMDVIWRTAAAMLGIALVAGALRYGMREALNSLSRWIEYDLRNDLLAHLLSLDAAYFGRMRTGELMARLTNDLGAVRMAAGPAIMYLVSTITGGLFALGFMLRIDARLTVLALLPLTVLPVLTIRLGRLIHQRFEEVQEHFGTLTTRVQENLSGTRVVRAYRQERAELARFEAMSEEYLRRNMAQARLNGFMHPGFSFLAGGGAVIVLGVGGAMVIRGNISVGAFVAFGMYLSMLTWPLIALGWVTNLFQRGAASMGRLGEIFDARPAVTPPAKPRDLPPRRGGRDIEFRRVSFRYPSRDGADSRWVLRDVSFGVRAGQTIGIVGGTGSGKTTLLELLPRIHDATEGDVLVDGIPIRELSIDSLRRELGVVPQESLLFSETIGANLAYGLIDAADDAGARELPTLERAATVAQLADTIRAFPGGYETLIGERGVNLSGGQRQRAAMARALARAPSIVILDDALSAVDTHTEAAILHGLRDALADRTALVASHRISAVRDADWILVLDDGRIVEQGRHDELVAAGGRYAVLAERQAWEE